MLWNEVNFTSKMERNKKKEKFRQPKNEIHTKKMLDLTLNEMTKLTGL